MVVATADIQGHAQQMDSERTMLENAAAKGIPRIGRTFTRQATLWVRGGLIGRVNFQPALDQLADALTDVMVAGHLLGKLRALRAAAPAIARGVRAFAFEPESLHHHAIAWIQARTKLEEAELIALGEKYTPQAIEVTRNLGLEAERAGRTAASQIVSEGMHVRQATQQMRFELAQIGVTAQKPWLLETLARTQTQLAYGAGHWTGNQDPAIQEILWGYQYKTVGDDRVRLNHVSLEGVTLPKDHVRWKTIWPPNGYNCRCVPVEIFKDEADKIPIMEVPTTAVVDGIEVIPGPDKGWGFNPGMVY